jgi:hypothetical protein
MIAADALDASISDGGNHGVGLAAVTDEVSPADHHVDGEGLKPAQGRLQSAYVTVEIG